MSDYRVIPYRPELLPEIVRLWEDHGRTDIARRTELFRWFSEGNPFLQGRPPYYCLHDGERVVGMHGYMPLVIDVDGAERLGQMAQDDLLHASCRGKGLHKVLLDGATADAPNVAGAMWFNEVNHRSYLKCGWTDVPGFRRYVFFLDAARLADELGERRALALAVRAAGPLALSFLRARVRRAGRSGVRIDAIDRFDDRCERLYRKLAPGLGIAVRRSAAYLDWRFVAKPGGAYRRLAAMSPGGELAGWLVYRIDRSEASP
ncbi:MAG TPA: hypothetical protein VNE71_18300, partial [Myxococcota bacterium]|nr:hypothetical protein [Myxococcota bacterium]